MQHPSGSFVSEKNCSRCGSLEYGGLEKLLVEFARHCNRERFDLHFVSLTNRGPIGAELEALGWPVTALEMEPGLHPGEVVRLSRLLKKANVDVVHTHNTRALLYGGPAARVARMGRIIHTRHGQAFGKSSRDRWLRRLGSQLADRVVCVSHDSRRLAASEGIPTSRLRTVWNGIDCGRFKSANPGRECPVIALGRLSPEKDYCTLIRAVRLVAQEAPEFRLKLGGGGACESEVRELVKEFDLTPIVSLLGPVGDVSGLMASGSVLAHLLS